jgi:hypothetical protein
MREERRTKVILLCLGIGLLGMLPASQCVAAEDTAQEMFHNARTYTVRIKTQITTPFVEDERGSFQGAGFLIDSERGRH